IRRQGLIEQYTLGEDVPFTRVYLKEIGTVLYAVPHLCWLCRAGIEYPPHQIKVFSRSPVLPGK
ncbi:MAG: hypothetical protein KY448_02470, partial [Cyanobacteria bacterium 0813]|nr:hypothetical protein [Cyanobacteria bacterium 0813]